ncbi:purine-nucleoside phosphorylase [Fusobacterium perfoetens]|uniref:purine-nucleoside phosphorylase n=1 Tax=Fusobacterium perfoetens TaxID=852 RepID=UPI000484E0A5|nr:purine-nucleoside phosphorylase [Fusobacterium perfoetens]
MSTPHNSANVGEIAKNVLMPGDPLRAKFIAETFLEDVKLVNSVRNMFAYTGKYKGKEITVMGSGMGMPSIGIYSYELFSQYGVENILRIGSAGAYVDTLNIFDIVLVESAWSESSFAKTQNGYEKDETYPDEELNKKIKETAKKLNIPIHLSKIHSSDVFYRDAEEGYYKKIFEDKGCEAVEMESFALFHNAKVLGKKAACLLTISDSFTSKKATTAEERQLSFTNMMKIALETFCD